MTYSLRQDTRTGWWILTIGCTERHYPTKETAEAAFDEYADYELRTKGKIRVQGRALDVLREIERVRE